MLKLWLRTSYLLLLIFSSSFSVPSFSASMSNSGYSALRGRQKTLTPSNLGQKDNETRLKVETSNQSFTDSSKNSHENDEHPIILISGGLSSGFLGLIVSSYGFRLFVKSVKEPNIFLHTQYGKVMCFGTAASILGFTMMGVGIHSYMYQKH